MVILRSQNKINDFLMILAWASPFNYDSSYQLTLCTDSDGMMERDGFDLVAGSAVLGRDVHLARWLDRKCASERENVGGDSEGKTRSGSSGNPNSLTNRRGARRRPHSITTDKHGRRPTRGGIHTAPSTTNL